MGLIETMPDQRQQMWRQMWLEHINHFALHTNRDRLRYYAAQFSVEVVNAAKYHPVCTDPNEFNEFANGVWRKWHVDQHWHRRERVPQSSYCEQEPRTI